MSATLARAAPTTTKAWTRKIVDTVLADSVLARAAGLPKRRLQEYVPYCMLEVQAPANAVYQWAADRLLERRFAGERPVDLPSTRVVRYEAQALHHRAPANG